jgi:hypothetical protein
MQKILACGNCDNFHRKFGELTEGKRGVYIWGFAKEDFEIPVNCDPNNATMKQFEVQVSSENIGIFYVGKVESKSSNIFERIMQERANLFGGFSPIFIWEHYFKEAPFLSVWQQLDDTVARDERYSSKAHLLRLKKYQDCTCGQTKPFQQLKPILHSNASFHENNLFERLITPKNDEDIKLQESLSKISKNFIFTWIDISDKASIKSIENLLHHTLGVNTLGTGKIKTINNFKDVTFDDLKPTLSISPSETINFSNNQQLFERIQKIHSASKDMIKDCNCFKG